ncbi:MAG: glucoamylase family protein [Parcubacteria group bacterium]
MFDNRYKIFDISERIFSELDAGKLRGLLDNEVHTDNGYPRLTAVSKELINQYEKNNEKSDLRVLIIRVGRKTKLTYQEIEVMDLFLNLESLLLINQCLATMLSQAKEIYQAQIVLKKVLKWQNRTHSYVLPAKWIEKNIRPLGSLSQAFFFTHLYEFGFRLESKQQNSGAWAAYEKKKQEINKKLSTAIKVLHITTQINWEKIYEEVLLSAVELKKDPSKYYEQLTISSRLRYLKQVGVIAERTKRTEQEVAAETVKLAGLANTEEEKHVGFYLFPEEVRPGWLFIATLCFGSLLIAITLSGYYWFGLAKIFWGLFIFFPVYFAANTLVMSILRVWQKQRFLGQLDFYKEVPAEHATFVVTPCLLINESTLRSLVLDLETTYAGNPQNNIYFGLLLGLPDSNREHEESDDPLIRLARVLIDDLNKKHPLLGTGKRFFVFIRKRVWNEGEGVFMEWERKRGKLEEFNRLLITPSATTSFLPDENLQFLPSVRYVLTIDEKTRLPIGEAAKLIGTIAHPLNQPRFDEAGKKYRGFGIIQPRLIETLESAHTSLFSRLFSGSPGLDIYSLNWSDLYFDLFQSGLFFGKGIYDIKTIEATCRNLPENRILSHDHLEGALATVAFASDIYLAEEFSPTYKAEYRRQHRWIRGDWQAFTLLPSLSIPPIEKWKIFDNVLRSLLLPVSLALVTLAAFKGLHTLFLLTIILWLSLDIKNFLISLRPPKKHSTFLYYLFSHLKKTVHIGLIILSKLIFWLDNSWRNIDAIIRTLWRLTVSHKKLLEWKTDYLTRQADGQGLFLTYREAVTPTVLAIIGLSVGLTLSLPWWWVTLNLLWLFAPGFSWFLSRPTIHNNSLTEDQRSYLDQILHEQISFFLHFSTDQNNYLIPDFIQSSENIPRIATQTSATNIGFLLLALVAARETKRLTDTQFLKHVELSLETITGLLRCQGHLYNWYDIQNREVVGGNYVSSVDSANFTIGLIVLNQYLKELYANNSKTQMAEQILVLIGQCEQMLNKTDFSVFFDEDRGLFRIGFNDRTDKSDDLFYDLLISEANLISYLAIAMQQVNPNQWFRHGRRLTRGPFDKPLLVSWSGSLFEYLTSLLFLPAPEGSTLYHSGENAVIMHKNYVRKYKIPWGMGESAFSLLGADGRYQYRMFGITPLAMRWDVKEHLVVSPYNSILALNFQPQSVIENLHILEKLGMKNQFGFYDAIDYTTNRSGQVVKVIYAHHQGFSLVSILNILFKDRIKNLFLSDPRMKAASLFLQESVPRVPARREQEETNPLRENLQHSGILTRQVLSNVRLTKYLPYRYLANRQLFVSNVSNRGGWLGWQKYYLTKRSSSTDPIPHDYQILLSVEGGRVISLARAEKSHDIPGGLNREFKVNGVLANLTIVLPENIAGEIRELTLENRTKNDIKIQAASFYQPSLLPVSDHSNPRYQDMFIRTKWSSDNSKLLHSRSFPLSNSTLYFAHHIVSDNKKDEFSALIGGRDLENIKTFFDAYKKSPNLINPSSPYGGLAVKKLLKPGEKYQIRWLSTASNSIPEIDHNLNNLKDSPTKIGTYTTEWINHYQQEIFEILGNGLECGGFIHTRPAWLKSHEPFVDSLWRHGLNDEHHLVVFKIDTLSHVVVLEHLLSAQQFLENRHILFDVIVINTHSESYRNILDVEIESMINSYRLHNSGLATKVVHLRSRLLSEPEVGAFYQSADAIFDASHGYIEEQIQRQAIIPRLFLSAPPTPIKLTEPKYQLDQSTGDFIFELPPNTRPWKPWVNLLTNKDFGTLVDDHGRSFSWYKNSQELRITKWDDTDPYNFSGGEWFVIKDRQTSKNYLLTHGTKTNTIVYSQGGVKYIATFPFAQVTTEVIVSRHRAEKVVKIEIENTSKKTLDLDIKAFAHFVLGRLTHQHIQARLLDSNVVEISNQFHHDFRSTVRFELSGHAVQVPPVVTGEWTNFGNLPLEIVSSLIILPGQKSTILSRIGIVSEVPFEELTNSYFSNTKTANNDFWQNQKNTIQIETPDKSLDYLFNHWLLYQTRTSRLEGRVSLWQPSGAFGFRDQLQDAMPLSITDPSEARSLLLYIAGRQFDTGNALNWWHPGSDFGLGRAFTDHQLWLVKVALFYVGRTGDNSIWSEVVPFKKDPGLGFRVKPAWTGIPAEGGTDTLFGHCVRALDFSMKFGSHNLPLIGQSDWNDGLGEIGNHGHGESIWTGFLLQQLLREFASICLEHNDKYRAKLYQKQSEKIGLALETHGWDGEYYRRAFRDNGEILGSHLDEELKIDSITQSWSILGFDTVSDNARRAIENAWNILVDSEAKLLAPPLTGKLSRVGHLEDYPAGVRENGSQYNHAALWLAQAFAKAGDNNKVYELIKLVSPIHRAEKDLARYRGEPYAVAADIYAKPAVAGEAGWTWYTASAGVLYLTILESMFGIKINQGKELIISPSLPTNWNNCRVKVKINGTTHALIFKRVEKSANISHIIRLENDGGYHEKEIEFS